jgi:4'-phosphopantetheinyl transferase
MTRDPAAGECHVWWARPSRRPAHVMQLLDGKERARSAAFHRLEDRWRFVTARALTRTVLGRYLDVDPVALHVAARCNRCGSTSHGKPRLVKPDANMEMSLSHSGDLVAVAVARSVAVGVDVQEVTPRALSPAVARRFLTEAELGTVGQLPEPERTRQILQCFTSKEALLKATGLAVPLKRIDTFRLSSLVTASHLAELHPADGYVASAALTTDEPYVVIERNGESLLAGH